MAAVRSPLMPSPSSGLPSAFSPHAESPSSPAHGVFGGKTERSSTDSHGRLVPQPQKSPQAGSPSEAGPSPIVSSNGTDFEDTPVDDAAATAPVLQSEELVTEPSSAEMTPAAGNESPSKTSIAIATKDANGKDFPAASDEDHPSSVIHAPAGLDKLLEKKTSSVVGRITPTPSQRSDITVISHGGDPGKASVPISPPPLSTSVPPTDDTFMTPRAQTRVEAESSDAEASAGSKPSLEDIPEKDIEDESTPKNQEKHKDEQQRDNEIAALRTALTECWTLCNTLAGLSHRHRKRAFQQKRPHDGREQAWESCWTLCQRLYVTWDESQPSPVSETLSLCRQFCQSLFEVRQKDDDLADAVLRVSFELNNHLYNTHDKSLPEPYRERTLDFYITLCHRLMKQRNKMAEETDDLLRACWSLAEMLFSLRQNMREGQPPNEELLGSAVQSCWDLCDLFREGWTQIRPDRGTPRPSQTTFMKPPHAVRNSEVQTITLDETDYEDDDTGRLNPETPTTIFEDMNQMSPDDSSVPNIVVLGPDAFESRYTDWSSASSSRSSYASEDEKTNSSSATINQTTQQANEDPRLTCLKILIINAAVSLGFDRQGTESFASFVKSLPSNSFGTLPWQTQLLEQYRRLIAADPAFRVLGSPRRASASDIARSVSWMVGTGQYQWLRDLYRSVFGFRVEEAGSRPNMGIEG